MLVLNIFLTKRINGIVEMIKELTEWSKSHHNRIQLLEINCGKKFKAEVFQAALEHEIYVIHDRLNELHNELNKRMNNYGTTPEER